MRRACRRRSSTRSSRCPKAKRRRWRWSDGVVSRLSAAAEYDPGLKETPRGPGAGADPDPGGGLRPAPLPQPASISTRGGCRRSSSGSRRCTSTARKYRVSARAARRDACASWRERLDVAGRWARARRSSAQRSLRPRGLSQAAAAAFVARARARAESSARRVTEQMQGLAMAGGRFEVALTPVADGKRRWSRAGRVPGRRESRRAAAAAGQGRLRAASCRASAWRSRPSPPSVAEVPTLVFDEVDAGIGGRVAEIVGPDAAAARAQATRSCASPICRRWRPRPTGSGRSASPRSRARCAAMCGRWSVRERVEETGADAGRGEDHRDHAPARGRDAWGQA